MDNLVLTDSDGSIPDPIPGTQAGHRAFLTVTPDSHRLRVDAVATAPASGDLTAATLATATKTVTTAGTAVALSATSVHSGTVVILPLSTNTGSAFIGFASGAGLQAISLPVTLVAPEGKYIQLSSIYVNTTVNGEGVIYASLA